MLLVGPRTIDPHLGDKVGETSLPHSGPHVQQPHNECPKPGPRDSSQGDHPEGKGIARLLPDCAPPIGDDGPESPITSSFVELLFMSLKEELQLVKEELSQDLKMIRSDVMELGDRVAAVEDQETPRDKEIEQLQQ
ncbi:hypothetical protein NDU88_006820 [Pleurodeles waltl]|uniref:Uncharacterized protein n=1 Tax=Pleurodeles waltl TaxID=8319 RepID=A0AAV7RSZ2_PLEWA|nr:hypothetical protein NDU88_006820 [Pleurodeles waltl]